MSLVQASDNYLQATAALNTITPGYNLNQVSTTHWLVLSGRLACHLMLQVAAAACHFSLWLEWLSSCLAWCPVHGSADL